MVVLWLRSNTVMHQKPGTTRQQHSCFSSVVTGNSGYTLYLLLIILSITAILFSVTIAHLRRSRIFIQKELQRSQAKLLATSGMVRTEYFLNGGDGHTLGWETGGYEERVDDYGKIGIVAEQFGLYKRVTSTGKRYTTEYTASALYGRTVPAILLPALTLTGHVGGLILHKGSRIEGDIVLHHGYVYAKKRGNPLPDYTRRLVFKESDQLPFDTSLIPELCSRLTQQITSASGKNQQQSITISSANDTLLQHRPLVINGDCRLITAHCRDADIIVKGTCTIEASVNMENSRCIAQKMVVEGGSTNASLLFAVKSLTIQAGTHSSQFICSDTITVAQPATCAAATILAGVRTASVKDSQTVCNGGIYLAKNSTFKGTIICCNAPGINKSMLSPSIVIGKGCTITGTIITDSDVEIYECTITGHVWARAVVAEDSEGKYTNYFIASSIRKGRQPVVFPLVGGGVVKIVVAR